MGKYPRIYAYTGSYTAESTIRVSLVWKVVAAMVVAVACARTSISLRLESESFVSDIATASLSASAVQPRFASLLDFTVVKMASVPI